MKTECLQSKVKHSIVCGEKGKDRVTLIKSIINARVVRGNMMASLFKRICLSDQKVSAERRLKLFNSKNLFPIERSSLFLRWLSG